MAGVGHFCSGSIGQSNSYGHTDLQRKHNPFVPGRWEAGLSGTALGAATPTYAREFHEDQVRKTDVKASISLRTCSMLPAMVGPAVGGEAGQGVTLKEPQRWSLL